MNRFLAFCLLLVVMVASSCSEGPLLSGEGSSEPEIGLFDYSKMGGHPRLLLRVDDFARMQASIDSDARLVAVHKAIMDRSDYHLGQGPITYVKVGKRLLNESRRALERILFLAYSYRMTGESKYLEKAEDTLNEVSAFADWNQSEHYLDVAEMAFGVAIGIDWLYDDLRPETLSAAKAALKSYAFDTFMTDDGKVFRESMSNWNQVCVGGLMAAAIACYEDDPSAMAQIIEFLHESNKTHAMTIYNTDGNYSEGYTYWAYGTTYQVIIMALLENIFGHDGGLKDSVAGFAKTGQWIMFMEGPSGKCFNFSDCNEPIYPRLPLWYISSYYNDSSVLYKELPKIDDGSYAKSFDERRFLPLVQIFADASLLKGEIAPPLKKVWYGGETVETHPTVLVHTNMADPKKDYFLALKGGRASTSHAHMDGGSFVYDAYGLRWATDLGLQKYNGLEEYGIDLWNFGKESTRWSVFRLNNFSHNVITVNDNIYHFDGGSFLDKKFNTDRPGALGGRYICYPLNLYTGADNDLVSPGLTRTAELKPLIGVHPYELEIKDEFTACAGKSPKIRWSMATPAAAEIVSDGCIKLTQQGVTLYLTSSEASGAKLKAFAREANASLAEWDESNDGVTLVGFEGEMSSGQKWTITTRLSAVTRR